MKEFLLYSFSIFLCFSWFVLVPLYCVFQKYFNGNEIILQKNICFISIENQRINIKLM